MGLPFPVCALKKLNYAHTVYAAILSKDLARMVGLHVRLLCNEGK